MADSTGERTEAATPQRRSDARKKGQVPRSMDLTSSLVFMGLLYTLRNFSGDSGRIIHTYAQELYTHINTADFSVRLVMQLLTHAVLTIIRALAPVLLVGMTLGLIVNIAQTGGFLWTTTGINPDFNRINPLTGAKKFVSSRAYVDLCKSLLKIGLIGYTAFSTARDNYAQLFTLSRVDIGVALSLIGTMLFDMALRVVAALLVLAALDYAYQRWQHEKTLRMSKDDVKREHKSTEGDPVMKSRIRQRRKELLKKQMMSAVPAADVILTNPTHYAVALKYDVKKMGAPVVVAKGQDLIALKIRELANEHNIPIVENPPLTRAIFKQVDIGREIPSDLYEAVAEVMAFVYQINEKRGSRRAYAPA